MKSLEPLKGFQECQHGLPAHFLLNAYFGCLLSTECARQAFIQREKVFWPLKGEDTAFLMSMERLKK